MKKPLLCLGMVCCVSSGFAANAQKIHPVDSPVYHAPPVVYRNGMPYPYEVPGVRMSCPGCFTSRSVTLSESGKKSYDYVSMHREAMNRSVSDWTSH